MDSTKNDRADVFEYLMSTNCVVKMSTRAVINGSVRDDYVALHKAPPTVVAGVVEKFVMVSLTEDGLLIPTT